MASQSQMPNQSTKPSSRRRASSLPEDLQKLLDKEELYWDSYGDFENSWTSTYVHHPLHRITLVVMLT